VDAEVLYYMQLAQSYHLPCGVCPWSAVGCSNPIVMPPGKRASRCTISTSGRALANCYRATQIWKRRQGLVYGQREGTPDAFSCSIPQAVCPTRAPNSRKPC